MHPISDSSFDRIEVKTFPLEIPNQHIGRNKDIDPEVVVRSLTETTLGWSEFEAHLMSGQPYSFNGIDRNNGKRHASGFRQASHIAMDSDRNATCAEILSPANPLAYSIRYIAPSPSDKRGYRKLRVIFQLAHPICDSGVLRSTLRVVYDEFLRFGVRFDPACLDPTRWYYAKETDSIVDFEINEWTLPAADYMGVLRLPACQPLDLRTLSELEGELERRTAAPTLLIVDTEPFANLLENELRQAGVLLERRDRVNEKVICQFKLTHCFTSSEHAGKDHNGGAYSNANLTLWQDGSLTYHCFGGTCAGKTIHHFLRHFHIKNPLLRGVLDNSTKRSRYTPQGLIPDKYPHRVVINERYLSNTVVLQEIQERLVILDSPLGTGKTQCLANYVDFCRWKGKMVLTVIPRRTLGTQAALRFDVVDYQGETQEDMMIPRSRTICPPSLDKLVDESETLPAYDVLIIDEPSKVLQFFTGQGQSLFKPESPSTHALRCARVLMEIGRGAEKIIIGEACFDSRVAWLIRRLFDIPLEDVRLVKNEFEEQLPVTLWGLTDSIFDSEIYKQVGAFFEGIGRSWETKNRFRDWMKCRVLVNAVQAARKEGIPLVIGCDELEDGVHGIRRFLVENEIPPEAILTITSETRDSPEVHAFLQEPNAFIQSKHPGVILHTAAMETGFSVEERCGVVVIAAGRNHTLDASGLLQMAGRCRNPAFIDCFLDERFRSEDTDSGELITGLLANHKYLEAKHGLPNQRFSAVHAWLNEIHAQLTAESNRQRMRLIESVPALLLANGYALHWTSLEQQGCTFEAVVGKDSLHTVLAVRNERNTRQDIIINSQPISPDIVSQHRRQKTLTEEGGAGGKKGKLLELLGAEWVGEGRVKDTLQLKPENAELLRFIERSSFNERGDPILVPTRWNIEDAGGWAKLAKTKQFIVPESFFESREDISDEAVLGELSVNNGVKGLKLHKPRNRKRFEAFCELHGEIDILVDADFDEQAGALPLRAFKDPRRQIADYCRRLIDQISRQEGVVWIRGKEEQRINQTGAVMKSNDVLNVDHFIQRMFERGANVEGFSVGELVRSYFRSTGNMMDRGDFLGACRAVLYDYFYRVGVEYNPPAPDAQLFQFVPTISRQYEVKRMGDVTIVVLDAADCLHHLKGIAVNTRVETLSDCVSALNHQEIDGKPPGVIWFGTGNKKQILGVPCRIYRSIGIDREIEAVLLSLKATPECETVADAAEVTVLKEKLRTTAGIQMKKNFRREALDQIEVVISRSDCPMSARAISDAMGLAFEDASKKAITRRLNTLMAGGKIGRTGHTDNVVYFSIRTTNGAQAIEPSPDASFSQLGTKVPFLNKEDSSQNSDFVPSSPGPVSPLDSVAFPGASQPSEVSELPATVRYITRDEDVADALGWLEGMEVGLDFETYADCNISDPLYVKEARPRLLSVSDGTSTAVFDCDRLGELPETLRDWLSQKTVVCHNAVFDLAFLHRWGIQPKRVIDTMLMESVICGADGAKGGADGAKGGRSLRALCEKYLNETLDKTEQTADWSSELTGEMISYAALDAKVLVPLKAALDAKITALGMNERAYQLFCDAIPAVIAAKQVGMPIDVAKTQRLYERLKANAESIEKELTWDYGRFGYTNANSTQKIARVLHQAFGVEVKHTSREALVQLSLDTDDTKLKTFVEGVLSARRLMKTATELEKYTRSAVNGWIHANYLLNGAISGRTTCSTPNLQQVSKGASVEGSLKRGEIRSCFVAPAGYQFVVADYSQIELVLNAIHCGDKNMLSAFRNGADIHAHTAAKIYGKPIEQISNEERQVGKSANFGLQYGMGAEGFQHYAKSYGIQLSQEEAAHIRRAWFESYPQVAAHHSHVKSQRPQTIRTISGRVIRTTQFTAALNLPIQGSSADLLNRAVAIIHEGLRPYDASLVAFVHDELVVLAKAGVAGAVAREVEGGMRAAGREFYPDYQELIRCEVKISADWAGNPFKKPAGEGCGAQTDTRPDDPFGGELL